MKRISADISAQIEELREHIDTEYASIMELANGYFNGSQPYTILE